MRNNILSFVFTAGLFCILFISSMPEPINPPTANTGAPGETSCMLSNCHGGGNFIGEVSIMGIPDTVTADQSYTITLKNISNAIRSGFQLTSLDATNKFVGTLTGNSGVNVAKDPGNMRTYARQSRAIFFANGEVSWQFLWKAPASVINDSIVFYFASMCANGDGNRTFDNSVKNKKRVFFKLAVENDNPDSPFSSFDCSCVNGELFISGLPQASISKFELMDLNGNLIFSELNPTSLVISPGILHTGIYVIRLRSKDQYYSKKVFIAGSKS